MPELVINEADLRDLQRARRALLGGALDEKRPRAWDQYGYPVALTFDHYLNAYERSGAAHGAIHCILDKCWQEKPRIKKPGSDEESEWERQVSALLTGIRGWQKLRDFDRRNMIGRFAGLVYRVADNKPLREPLARGGKLVDIVPLYENQITVTQWESDPNSPDFGKPLMFQIKMQPPQGYDTQGKPMLEVDVHPSRVQIMAEGSVGNFFDGVPMLKAGYNALVDLEKITGGSAESFLKNSARTLVLEYEKGSDLQALADATGTSTTEELQSKVQAKTDRLNTNQDSGLVMMGGKASTLQTAVADPEPSFLVAGNTFAASIGVAFTIIFGQQTGRLASDQDIKGLNARCKSRQINELTPVLTEFITRAQAAGWIDAGEFEIEWPPLDAPGDKEKAELLGKLTAAMQQAFQAGLTEPLFDGNELRKVMGFEEREGDGMPQEGDPAEDDDADPVPPRQMQRVA